MRSLIAYVLNDTVSNEIIIPCGSTILKASDQFLERRLDP